MSAQDCGCRTRRGAGIATRGVRAGPAPVTPAESNGHGSDHDRRRVCARSSTAGLYKRGRDNIFGTKESGAVVPYGERWRTGANEASEITVTRDVLVAGQKLAAGTYSLSTTPAAGTWKVHFNSRLGLDGLGVFANNTFTPVDLAPTDVLTVPAPATELPADKEVDQLTFEFEKTAGGADMVLRSDPHRGEAADCSGQIAPHLRNAGRLADNVRRARRRTRNRSAA